MTDDALAQQEEYRVRDTDGDREPHGPVTEARAEQWAEFEAWEKKAAAAGSGMTREQMTGAVMFDIWLGQREAEAALLARPQPVETDPPSVADGPSVSGQSLAELERLARAATPGPWKLLAPLQAYRTQAVADAAYIAAANPATVLALLARRAPGDRGRNELRERIAALPFYPDAGNMPVDVPPETSRRLRAYRAAVLRALAADSRPEQPE